MFYVSRGYPENFFGLPLIGFIFMLFIALFIVGIILIIVSEQKKYKHPYKPEPSPTHNKPDTALFDYAEKKQNPIYSPSKNDTPDGVNSAMEILKNRLARGEINIEEYDEIKNKIL